MLTDWDKMSNLYRRPAIDASYQVSVNLIEGFQRRKFKCGNLTDDGRQVMVKAHSLWQGELSIISNHFNCFLLFLLIEGGGGHVSNHMLN